MADADTEIFLDLCFVQHRVWRPGGADGYSQLSIGRMSHSNPDISIISFGKIVPGTNAFVGKVINAFGSRTDLRQNMDDRRRQITGICRCSDLIKITFSIPRSLPKRRIVLTKLLPYSGICQDVRIITAVEARDIMIFSPSSLVHP